MKFSGELKFPEVDHPGVPVNFIIEGSQAELLVDDESLGRWSLYDVHARRLVASAFQIDLDGTEVTFVADDPIDFAYRGVEHMAETWATLKSRRIATRSIAVRKSRKGTSPGRIEDMKSAMISNLEGQTTTRPIAGEEAMPDTMAEMEPVPQTLADDVASDQPAETPEAAVAAEQADHSEEWARLEDERQRLAEARSRFEEERRIAEQREADRIEAYRLEVKRLEAEREALRRQAEEIGVDAVADKPDGLEDDFAPGPEAEPAFSEEDQEHTGTALEEDEPEHAESEPEHEEAGPTAEAEEEASDAGLVPDDEGPEEEEPAEGEEPEPGVVDLKDLEEPDIPPPEEQALVGPTSGPAPVTKEPEPALAGASKDRSGLMGAVRAAFRSGTRDHEHRFIEAPGGIGITRYVCEECGYVSISV